MIFKTKNLGPGGDWESVSRLIGCVQPDAVTEFDVARLRCRVRGSLSEMTPPARAFLLRFAAVAATVVVGAASLFVALDGRDQRPGAPDSMVALSMSHAGGAVVFQFGDAERVHRIVKTSSPTPNAPGEVKTVRGGTFVDPNGQTRPGEVVFYRID